MNILYEHPSTVLVEMFTPNNSGRCLPSIPWQSSNTQDAEDKHRSSEPDNSDFHSWLSRYSTSKRQPWICSNKSLHVQEMVPSIGLVRNISPTLGKPFSDREDQVVFRYDYTVSTIPRNCF